MARFIRIEDIPESLWEQDKSILYLPSQLVSKWEMLLDKYHLRDQAMDPAPNGAIGGLSEKETNDFLAWRFTGSSARVIVTMLDPLQELPGISDIFTQLFSGNKVFLADLPCGSGAASLSILSTLCELRKQKKVPRMPLHIILIGGEISGHAQKYAREALEALKEDLRTQAITLDFQIKSWDACDRYSNTRLIRDLTISSYDCPSKLLFLVNFSGFLEREKKWKEANPQFDELFRHSEAEEGTKSAAIWIEPRTNYVIKNNGFFERLVQWFKRQFSKTSYRVRVPTDSAYSCSTVKVKSPIRDHIFKTNLAVIRFNLNSQNGAEDEA